MARAVTCVARVSAEGLGPDPTTPSGLRGLATPPFLDEPAAMLGRGALDGAVYASTSSAYAIGPEAETAVVSWLSRRIGSPVVATCAATVLALQVLDVARVAFVHPPWSTPS